MITPRIKNLQNLCKIRGKESKPSHFEKDYHYAALNLYSNLTHSFKLAHSMAYAIKNIDVWAYKEDKIGGRVYYTKEENVENKCDELDYISIALEKIKNEVPNFDELIKNTLISDLYLGTHLACNGHVGWNYNLILTYGVNGLKEKINEYIKCTKDEKSIEFYECVLILLDSLLEFNDKHIEIYEKLGNHELAEIMKRVPRYPARTFKEAVQSFFMQHIVVMRENPFGGNSPGRLDYYLWSFLKNDLENGVITKEEAKELIDELFLRIDERIYDIDIWSETIVVGGSDENGDSSFNLLSEIMIESIIDLNITHPSLYIRIPKNPSKKILNIASNYMMKGNNRAQILNDEAIIDALVKSNVEFKDAVHYMCGGCMEIGIQGKSCDFLYGGWQNCLFMLELLVTGGISLKTNKRINDFSFTKSLLNYHDFDSFYSDYLEVVKKYAHISFYIMDIFNELAAKNRPSFLLSSMIDNCLEKGRNINDGGAKYHNYGTTPMALPDVVDYLYALKIAVFDEKICKKKEMLQALINNFVGFEKLKNKLSKIPKFGVDNDNVDSFAKKVIGDIVNIYNSYKTRFGGTGNAVILTFIHGPYCASLVGARADGKNLGSRISYGLTPSSSSMSEGITAAINSNTKISYDKIPGGASTMWDIDSTTISEGILEVLIKTFIEKNGQIFQGNTNSVSELLKAQENPEDYSNLMVRVGGYSARFTNLSKEIQDDIIKRRRHKG